MLQPSCVRPLHRWPGFWSRLKQIEVAKQTHVYKHDGTFILEVPYTAGTGEVEGIAVHRNEFHKVLLEFATEIGLEIEFGKTVLRYLENTQKGSVLLADGTKIEADVVVAADGVGSNSWELVLKEKARAVSSGFAVYRSGYSTALGLANPTIKQFDESLGGKGWVVGFIGPNAHIVISKSQTKIGWLLTHMVRALVFCL